jgi:23S rRNA (cytidine1920-2'-O)/16S rRNA (cytidine1409-2'-O)-methyltransferase
MRIDQLLVACGLVSTRSQTQRLIADGAQWNKAGATGDEWRTIVKNSDEVSEDAPLQLLDDFEARDVSRGGRKLQAALKQVGLSVAGLTCLDVGQLTGGRLVLHFANTSAASRGAIP